MTSSSFYTDGPTNTGAVVAPAAPASFYSDPTAAAASAQQAADAATTAAASAAAAATAATAAAVSVTGKANIDSPTFTGVPAAPTPSNGDSSTRLATTAWVQANAVGSAPATAPPVMDGTAAVGASAKFAREDHVHPTDTSRASVTYVDAQIATVAPVSYVDAQDATKAPLASPALTGTPTAPTPTAGDNSTKLATTAFVASSSGAALRGYLSGLTLSTAGSSSVFSISAGVAGDSTNTYFMKLASAYSKSTAAWAVGTGTGALDTGTITANTWYHVFLVKRLDTGVVDVLVSLSATAPTLPASYTAFRRIGSMKTSASSWWTSFTQVGDEFRWAANVGELTAFAITDTVAHTLTLAGVPTGVIVNCLFHGAIAPSGSANGVLFTSLDEADAAVLGLTGSRNASLWAQTSGAFQAGDFNVRTNASAQFRWRAFGTTGTPDVSVYTYGWIDRRGRDA